MDLVIDANILFSICINTSKAEDILFSNGLNIFAPEFLFEEFKKYEEYILNKTKRNKLEFEKFLRVIEKRIKIIPNEETKQFLEKARKISPDPNDVDYFALALKLHCAIWSNDKLLSRQSLIKIYGTNELINKLNI